MRYVPFAGLAAVIVFGIGGRAWLRQRRYGSLGIVLFRSRGARPILYEGLLLLLSILVIGQAAAYAAWPQRIFAWMLTRPFNVAGSVALFSGAAVLLRAQLDLGASWRVGIDEGAAPGLVTGGLYRFSRNPIFTWMLVAAAGCALLIPTWLSLITLAGSAICLRAQVLEEEAYLRRSYGTDFLAYASRVGRFLPWMGRLHR